MEHVTSPKDSYPLAILAAEALANSPFSPISMYNTILLCHLSPSNFQFVASFNQEWQTKDLKDMKFHEVL